MREYEVIHVQSPCSNTLFGPLSTSNSIEFEVNNGDSFVRLHPQDHGYVDEVRSGSWWMTVIVREKRSYFLRFFHSLSLILSVGHPGSRVRQGPDMKLKQRWILLAFLVFSLLLLLLLSTLRFKSLRVATQTLGLTVDIDHLTERNKCPACFGANLCPAILNDYIELNDWNKLSMTRFVNVKNVFYATWRDKGLEREVVLKKLGHEEELIELDRNICLRHQGVGSDNCDVSESLLELLDKYKMEGGKGIVLNAEEIGVPTDILLCPSHRKMDFLLDGPMRILKGHHHDTILANVLTMLLLNPEPLLLQAFPQSDGWPFPIYYGACGRVIVEEYVGRRLTTFYNDPFLVRASIAKQLLEMSNLLYKNPTNFSIYFTDMSPDNFAVDEDTMRIKAIDLEHFIVVDKEFLGNGNNPNSEKLLEGESYPCGGGGNDQSMCLSFSPDDLCTRPLNDHNYFAVCAGLLANGALEEEFPMGLLHSIPSEFSTNQKLQNFPEVLLKCKDPKLGNPNLHYTRVEAAQELIYLLDVYLKTKQAL